MEYYKIHLGLIIIQFPVDYLGKVVLADLTNFYHFIVLMLILSKF